MSRRTIYILILFLTFAGSVLKAQDARIAHPFLWYSYYNPAYCGSEVSFKADLGATQSYFYRNTVFVDSYLSAEIGTQKYNAIWGFGLKALNEYQGSGLLNISKISPALSVGMKWGEDWNASTHIRIGVQCDVLSAHINKNKMVFADQLDAYYGLVNQASSELEYIENDNLWGCDLGVGLFGQTSIPANRFQMPVIINYGFSAFNLIGEDTKSFYTGDKALYLREALRNRRYCGQLECAVPYTSSKGMRMYFKAYGIYQYQATMQDVQVGLIYNVYKFMAGVGMKFEDFKKGRDFTNLLFHFVFSHPLSSTVIMRIAYSGELPLTQNGVGETYSQAISLHFVWNTKRNTCDKHIHPTDVAWYEANNTFPTKSRK